MSFGSLDLNLTTQTGTYDQFWVSAIEGQSTSALWEGKIRASFVLGGQTYYTKSDDTLSTEAPAEDATFRYNGGRMDSFLPTPFVLAPVEGESSSAVKSVDMQLFFDPLYIAFALDTGKISQGVTNSIGSGTWCIGQNAGIKLCVQRMQVTASTESALPTRERYLINESGLLSILFDSADNPLGGSLNPNFVEGQAFRGFDGGDISDIATENRTWATGSLAVATANTDGSYTVGNLVSIDPAAKEEGGFKASQFKRETHQGTFQNSVGKSFDYSAVKQE